MRAAVPRQGLAAPLPWRSGTLRDLARDMVAIARDGLRARARRNAAGEDESVYLAPLEAVAAGAPTQAEHWLDRYHRVWDGEVREIFSKIGDLKLFDNPWRVDPNCDTTETVAMDVMMAGTARPPGQVSQSGTRPRSFCGCA